MLTPEKKPQATTPKDELTYVQKVWQTVTIVTLLVITILIARVAFNVLLMVMCGTLISVYFHGLGDLIERNTTLSRKWAMTISVGGSFILLGLVLWFMGNTLETQIAQLSNSLPGTINNFKAKLSESPVGQKVLEYFAGDDDDSSKKLMATAQSFFNTSFGVLGNIYIIFFLGIFFTSDPDLYKNGILLLLPENRKFTGRYIINRISLALKGWLKGMMLSIVLITIMLFIGLSIMHIPVAIVLALIAGMLKIIPNFGSLAAMIPGVLLALTISTQTAIIVSLIYIVSQTIVSNIITPIIQNKMINLPPALTIISQIIMGTLSGVLGIIMAVPLLAIVFILVDELYVKPMNLKKAQLAAGVDLP
ncbi:AI-2E family transporter [Mucilaginibacter daejeonensis]|uniref:AI-2E family transporter n=1 Tax=Mucilaginibacter daejeonensis TaxID=398049 RepID=UPI001D17BEFF|nr:AI-2E family transporter [Mucilaginibacter daejeonensis]UEG54625.1 AI-2E family transporter [Mucilaginibacter daejeonensis]